MSDINEDAQYEMDLGGGGDERPSSWDGVERRRNPQVKTVEPRFRFSLSSISQIALVLITSGSLFAYLKADVEKLKADQIPVAVFQAQNTQILLKVTELQTQLAAMREEMVYSRQRLDQEIQRNRGITPDQLPGRNR